MTSQRAPMFERVDWHLVVNARTAEKARKVVGRVAAVLDRPLALSTIDPHRVKPTSFDVRASTLLESARSSPAAAVFDTLQLANRLAPSWEVLGPSAFSQDRWTFKALSARGFAVAGVTWAHFELSNF